MHRRTEDRPAPEPVRQSPRFRYGAAILATAAAAQGALTTFAARFTARAAEVKLDGTVLRWFSVVSTIGTPVDITAQELRVESFFPADEHTEQVWRALQRHPSLPPRPAVM